MGIVTLRGNEPLSESGRQVRYPTARWTAAFYKLSGQVVYTNSADDLGRPSDDLIQAETYKHIRNPIGTWSVTLVPRQDYFDIIRPGVWCEISSDVEDNKGERRIMYGPVTSVRQQRTVDERGITSTRVHISGTDFGRAVSNTTALLDEKLSGDPAFSNLAAFAPAIKELRGVTGKPGLILKTLIQRYLAANIPQWYDPKTNRPFGANLDLDYIDQFLPGEAVFKPVVLSTPLWQLLQQWSNPAMNELFIDYRPPFGNQADMINLVPAIVLRQNPLWGAPWDLLTNVEVKKSEVFDEALERSDNDVLNWIRVLDDPSVTGDAKGLGAYADNVGIMNTDSIKHFGIRRFEPATTYIFDSGRAASNQEPQNLIGILESFTGTNALWHHSNEELMFGALNMYHRPDIRVGYRLDYIDEEQTNAGKILELYVEGVRHQYSYPGKASTSVTVTRGRERGNRVFQDTLQQLEGFGVIQSIGSTILRAAQSMVIR